MRGWIITSQHPAEVPTSDFQGRIQGDDWGDCPPKTYESNFFTIMLYNSEHNIRDIRLFFVHCFVTELL